MMESLISLLEYIIIEETIMIEDMTPSMIRMTNSLWYMTKDAGGVDCIGHK